MISNIKWAVLILVVWLVLPASAAATPAFDYVNTVIESLTHLGKASEHLAALPTKKIPFKEQNAFAMKNLASAVENLRRARGAIVEYAKSTPGAGNRPSDIATSVVAFDRAYAKLISDLESARVIMERHLAETNNGNAGPFNAEIDAFVKERSERWTLIWAGTKAAARSMLEARPAAQGETGQLKMVPGGTEVSVRRTVTGAERDALIKKFRKHFGKRPYEDGRITPSGVNGFDWALVILWEALNESWA